MTRYGDFVHLCADDVRFGGRSQERSTMFWTSAERTP